MDSQRSKTVLITHAFLAPPTIALEVTLSVHVFIQAVYKLQAYFKHTANNLQAILKQSSSSLQVVFL